MQTQWSEWLAAERAAGRSGVVLAERPITRGKPWECAFRLPGNPSGSFTAGLFADVDADLPSLVPVTATLSAFDAGSQTRTLTLTIAGTATDSELPPDSNFDGLSEAVLKIDWSVTGDRALGLVIPIIE